MRTGKLAEPVWKRSVYRQLNMEIAGTSGHYGADSISCKYAEESGREWMTASVGPIPGSENDPFMQVTEMVNRLAVCGAVPTAVQIQAVLPESLEEPQFQAHMKAFGAAARTYQLEVQDVCAAVSSAVMVPQYFVIGTGVREHAEICGFQDILRPGQELVVTKWIALAGTSLLASEYKNELYGRYPFTLIDRAVEFEKLICVANEARAISHFGSCAAHHLGEGGIFTALWEMAERAGVGLEVDLKKIPVKQETVEITEYFDINPYYLYSAGSLLVGTEHAEALIAELAAAGIPAVVIGRVTDGKERVILNGEDRRYLDRPQQEEWYRKLQKVCTD